VEKYCRAGQATDDSIIQRMRFAYRMSKDKDTQNMWYLLLLHSSSSYAVAAACYVIRTLLVLLLLLIAVTIFVIIR